MKLLHLNYVPFGSDLGIAYFRILPFASALSFPCQYNNLTGDHGPAFAIVPLSKTGSWSFGSQVLRQAHFAGISFAAQGQSPESLLPQKELKC
jgi:hypothetical protein